MSNGDLDTDNDKLNESMQTYVEGLVEELRWYFGLHSLWLVSIINGRCVDENGEPYRGGCEADPEYSEARIKIDFERLQTGDRVEEIVIHELVHIPLMWLHNQADNLAGLAANMTGATHQVNALAEYNREQVRKAAEKSATDIGHTILRMYQRIKELEHRLEIADNV
jgi:hypothetical protein